jgi:hypothetical protein
MLAQTKFSHIRWLAVAGGVSCTRWENSMPSTNYAQNVLWNQTYLAPGFRLDDVCCNISINKGPNLWSVVFSHLTKIKMTCAFKIFVWGILHCLIPCLGVQARGLLRCNLLILWGCSIKIYSPLISGVFSATHRVKKIMTQIWFDLLTPKCNLSDHDWYFKDTYHACMWLDRAKDKRKLVIYTRGTTTCFLHAN